MAQIFQPELTDSFEIKVLGGDNVFKTVQEILDYGTSSNIGNCFILFDNCSDGYPALKNKGGYMIRFFYLQSLLTPTKVYLATDTYLKTGYGDSGTTIPDHMIGYAMYLINTEEPWNTITVSNTTAPSYVYHINTNGDFTNSTAWSGSWRRAFLNENEYYNTDTYIGYFGSGLHSVYDEVIYIDPSIYEELYIDGQYVPPPHPPEPTGDAEVRVSYVVPDDEYTYCNITWKMNSEPEDKDDGHTATLLKDESVINITNLVEGARYIFKIFTNKSESEPFPYIVGEAPVPPPEPEIGYVLFKDGEFGHPEIFTIQNAYEYSSGLTNTGHCGTDIQNNCLHIHLDKTGNPYQEQDGHYYILFNGNSTKLLYTKSPYTISNDTYAKRFINTVTMNISGDASLKGTWTGSGYGNKPLLTASVAIGNSKEISGVNYSRTLCILRPDEVDVTKTWSINNVEVQLQYVDEEIVSGGTLLSPALSFSIDATNKFNYATLDTEHMDLYVNNIVLKLDKHLRPYKDDTFAIYSEDDSACNDWTIAEIISEVKELHYNSFILRPIWGMGFTVLPFNLSGGSQLVTKRDKYIGSGVDAYTTIAIEGAFDDVDALPTYLSLNTSSHQLKRSTNRYSDPSLADIPIISNYNMKYPNPASVGSSGNTPGCVLYTEAVYEHYYINDVLIY